VAILYQYDIIGNIVGYILYNIGNTLWAMTSQDLFDITGLSGNFGKTPNSAQSLMFSIVWCPFPGVDTILRHTRMAANLVPWTIIHRTVGPISHVANGALKSSLNLSRRLRVWCVGFGLFRLWLFLKRLLYMIQPLPAELTEVRCPLWLALGLNALQLGQGDNCASKVHKFSVFSNHLGLYINIYI
jgi:hypothetical protein